MGKKILLWVLAVTGIILGMSSIFDELKTDNMLREILIVFVTILLVTRLVFDDAYRQASFRRACFLYAINVIVSATFFISLLFVLNTVMPKLSALEREQNPDNLLFQQYQERLRALQAESFNVQERLRAGDTIDEQEYRDFQVKLNAMQGTLDEQKGEESLPSRQKEETLLRELAETNNEPVSSTAIVIDKEESDFLRGRVVFAAEPKKNGIFFARQRKDTSKWEIFQNQMNDGLDCDGYEGLETEIPKSMLEDCIKYEKDGEIRAADGWELTKGDPSNDCSAVTYSGEVEIDAWFEWRNSYVEKTWMLAVTDDDRPKLLLGWPWKPYFSVPDISDKLRAKLMAASPEKPAKVTVKKMHYYCEGAPWLDIE